MSARRQTTPDRSNPAPAPTPQPTPDPGPNPAPQPTPDSGPNPAPDAVPWWADAVVYEVYLRSFADADGDGVGDLAGLTARMDHLARLGVDAVWVTPFYPSPGYDHGYDISDYTDVDRVFGDLDDFDAMVAAAHRHGLRVLIDVVPNHTSHQHPWFTAALREGRDGGATGSAGRGRDDGDTGTAGPRRRRYRDYYLWRDPAPDGGPPNNWLSNFGGPAWTYEPESGQYYYHAYLPEQPDLNWRNPDVAAEWRDILRFWLDRGVDGFRIDVAHNLLKHVDYPDNPVTARPPDDRAPVGRVREARRLVRAYDVDQEGTADIFRSWRATLPYTRAGEPAFLLGETVLDDPHRVARYLKPGRLDAALWFGTDLAGFRAGELATALAPGAAGAWQPGRLAWFLSNHDRARPASRFASGAPAAVGADRALAAAAAVLAMPGPYLLYQGEELGARDADIRPEDARDPIAVRANQGTMARDRARTPMPWTGAPDRGFSRGAPWLPYGVLPPCGAVDRQERDPTSHLNRWRSLLTVWRRHRDLLPRTVDVSAAGDLLRVRRGRLLAVVNTGITAYRIEAAGEVLWRSGTGDADDRLLRPAEAMWRWLATDRAAGHGAGLAGEHGSGTAGGDEGDVR